MAEYAAVQIHYAFPGSCVDYTHILRAQDVEDAESRFTGDLTEEERQTVVIMMVESVFTLGAYAETVPTSPSLDLARAVRRRYEFLKDGHHAMNGFDELNDLAEKVLEVVSDV